MGYQVFKASNWNSQCLGMKKNLRPNFKEAVFGVHVCLLWIWGHIYLTKKNIFSNNQRKFS